MFSSIKKWWLEQKAAGFRKKFLTSPLGLQLANTLWDALYTDKTYLGKFLSEDNKGILFNNAMSDICAMSISDDPVMECREYICNNVLELAVFKIPTIKEPPSKDYSDYRGLPGITGEIFQHINTLAKKDAYLKKFIWSCDIPDQIKIDQDYIYEVFLRRSAELELYLNSANILRIHLNDYKPDPERDWFRKFIEIEFALCESRYRKALELPDVLEEQSALGASADLIYSVYYNLIMNGKKYPRHEWEEMLAKKETRLM